MTVILGIKGATDSTGWTQVLPTADPGLVASGMTSDQAITAQQAAGKNYAAGTPASADGTGTRFIYVANSGSDAAAGTQAAPLATLTTAIPLARAGYPDHVLLNRGDSWVNSVPFCAASGSVTEATPNDVMRGRSADEPFLLSDWGTGARPIIKIDTRAFIVTPQPPGPNKGQYQAYIGIDFYAYKRDQANNPGQYSSTDGGNGFNLNSDQPYLLVEDCVFRYLAFGIGMSSETNGNYFYAIIRRNIFDHIYPLAGNFAQAIYIHRPKDFIYQENAFIHCGWDETTGIPSLDPADFNRTHSHSVYTSHDFADVTFAKPGSVENNIIYEDSSASTLRTGATITDNFSWSTQGFTALCLPTNETIEIAHNVILHGGAGLIASNYNINSYPAPYNVPHGLMQFHDNLGIHRDTIISRRSTAAMEVESGYTHLDVTVLNDVYVDCGASNNYQLNGTDISMTTVTSYLAGDNWLAAYPNANKTLADYYTAARGTTKTEANFLADLRSRGRGAWDSVLTSNAVNNFFRANFNMSPYTITTTTTTTTTPITTTGQTIITYPTKHRGRK